MYSWRKDSFDKLASLKERLASVPELSNYVSYTELLARGLRKEALKPIEDLPSTLRALPRERRKVFLVGEPAAYGMAVRNAESKSRCTHLKEKILSETIARS